MSKDLNELSKMKISKYADKALDQGVRTMRQRDKLGPKATSDEIGAKQKIIDKRVKGLQMAKKRMTKEDVINNVIEKFIVKDERSLRERVEDTLKESDEGVQTKILGLFDELEESNQKTLYLTLREDNGINEVMDFIISNRE